MPLKRKMKRKSRRRRRKRKSRGVAGDKFTRSFPYPPDNFQIQPVAYGASPTFSLTEYKFNLDNIGAADASKFLHFYQWYRISKIYLTIRAITREAIPVFQPGTTVPTIPQEGNVEVLVVPWRDGRVMAVSSINQSLFDKLRQTKGAKHFRKPFASLAKGFTMKMTPNTLNVGFSAQPSGTLQYFNYSPQYGRWITNNDGSVNHFGYQILVAQAGQSPLALKCSATVTIQYRNKCVDPLVGLEAETADNTTTHAVMKVPSGASGSGHALSTASHDSTQFRCVSDMMKNEALADPSEAYNDTHGPNIN